MSEKTVHKISMAKKSRVEETEQSEHKDPS